MSWPNNFDVLALIHLPVCREKSHGKRAKGAFGLSFFSSMNTFGLHQLSGKPGNIVLDKNPVRDVFHTYAISV
jgi:hypothetical protein